MPARAGGNQSYRVQDEHARHVNPSTLLPQRSAFYWHSRSVRRSGAIQAKRIPPRHPCHQWRFKAEGCAFKGLLICREKEAKQKRPIGVLGTSSRVLAALTTPLPAAGNGPMSPGASSEVNCFAAAMSGDGSPALKGARCDPHTN